MENKAKHVIKAFGGATRLSKILGIPRSTICMWERPKPTGSGGRIPDKHQRRLAKLALDYGLDINHYIIDETNDIHTQRLPRKNNKRRNNSA